MAQKTSKTPVLKEGEYTVKEVHELNSFDLFGNKNKTKGTSNKMYHIELQVAKSGDVAQLFSMYGPTGSVQKKEWRNFNDEYTAKTELDKILKSKRRKGYKDIDVAQRSLGSDEAKTITKAVTLKNADSISPASITSKLNEGQKRIIEIFFGSQQHFVATTLKCPLGQLTNKQIDDGRARLDRAKQIVNKNKSLNKIQVEELTDLTNEFYALIPHNLGAGARGQMSHLLLDTLDKIVKKEDDLDTLLDAKQIGAQLKSSDSLDAKYDALNADIDIIDSSSDLFKFISDYFMKSKVSHHGFTRAKVKNIWSMHRKDGEYNHFMTNTRNIAEQCGKHSFEKETNWLSNNQSKKWVPKVRPDLDKKEQKLFNDANVWLCWHGTRSANLVGITTRGLLIRPSGAVHTGSLYGDGKYFAWQSTKSLNYCDGGYWTGGRGYNDSRFMFLLDVAIGNQYVAGYSQYFKRPPKGHHSVYGKASRSGVMNDEMITYDFDKKDCQSRIRYLLEIVG